MSITITKPLTFEEFLAWDDGSGRDFELLDGVPVPLSEPNANHAEFNYSLVKSRLSLPQTTQLLDRLPELKQRIEDTLPFISLSNEAARRETLVAPVMLEVVRYCRCQMRIEYPLTINNWLKGSFQSAQTSSRCHRAHPFG